ncbi:MAG TPA: MarR family transcriptional regulator [Thermomicrobiales bacterium]|nr:MarR family transcriptional regulator [Thermomicrobiales bacterium]
MNEMELDSGLESEVGAVAAALLLSINLLRRQLRQSPMAGEPTLPEFAALSRLDRGGPATSSALAKLEQISPQSMGATLAALETRGLVERRDDPEDGRRVVLSITEAGVAMLQEKRTARAEQISRALASGFTREELEQLKTAAPLIERLAQNI